jgi:hypothetical protein
METMETINTIRESLIDIARARAHFEKKTRLINSWRKKVAIVFTPTLMDTEKFNS